MNRLLQGEVGWRQRRHAMLDTCLVALRAWLAVFPRWLEIVAGRWADSVNPAMRGNANLTNQRLAARLIGVGAVHVHPMRVEVFGQRRRHDAAGEIRFHPVEGHAKRCAARATEKTGMGHTSLVSDRTRESVALADVTGFETRLEPLHALCRGAMRERIRHDPALRLFLQGIVADGRRRVERRFDIARL